MEKCLPAFLMSCKIPGHLTFSCVLNKLKTHFDWQSSLTVVESLSHVRLCASMDCSTQAPLSSSILEFAQIHVHWVVALPNHLILCSLVSSLWKWKLLSCVRLFVTSWSPGQNTGVGSCSLLQGIFPTQGSNPGLLHCRQTLYQLSHQGSPRILELVAYSFSSGSSWRRNRTGFSCIADSLPAELLGKPKRWC